MSACRGGFVLLLWALGVLSGCSEDSPPAAPPRSDRGWDYTEERDPCADYDPVRNLYFGDLHFHTTLSHDGWLYGTLATPDDAYGFARGRPIGLEPYDQDGNPTRELEIDRPLDFAALTEHSEFLAETRACLQPASKAYDSFTCRTFRAMNFLSTIVMSNALFFPKPVRSADICGPGRADCPALAKEVWQEIRDAAEAAYDRTSACSFTTFVGYEYTGTTLGANLHRNVIFRNAHVPDLPVSYFEEPTPENLWKGLESTCREGMRGCDALSIPHNTNESNGKKFFVSCPGAGSIEEEREAAALRARMEPLVEIFQNKGDSECMNGFSGVPGEPDELCDFEKLFDPPFEDCGEGTGLGGVMEIGCTSRLDYVRNVLLAGLEEEERLGTNPYKLGIVGGTDTHNATPGAVAEDRFAGHLGNEEDTPEKRLGPAANLGHSKARMNPGGLTAVWAEENSRDAIFEAFRRRETYATSGPRIAVRFFGGWKLSEEMCTGGAFASTGYAGGVPMGSDLPPRPAGAGTPRFAVLALRDPGFEGGAGVPLQRIQIVKGWLSGDHRSMLKVFEVAGDPHNQAGVDLETCTPAGQGFDRLCTVWVDPEFLAEERAFYYVRVVENPSCRWSTYECNRLPVEQRPESCGDSHVRTAIQERAWTSPIWYRPAVD